MNQLAPSVLIMGYGKIGKMKANIWRNCGVHVIVSDISENQIQQAQIDGFQVSTNPFHIGYDFMDICTPSNTHIEILKQIVRKKVRCKRVVIEKPLFNTMQDKKVLYQLLDNDPSLYEKIIVNEQYYKSKTIERLQQLLLNKKVTHIEITMSKNRKIDIEHGRFVDSSLGAFGIELPHILAILDMLDTSIEKMQVIKNILYIDSNDANNQGIRIEYIDNKGTTVVINSFLGNFKVSPQNQIVDNTITDRHVFIEGQDFTYKAILDPHPSNERLFAELNLDNKSIWIRDDMLTENISDMIRNKMVTGCKLESAIRQSEQIISLFNDVQIIKIMKEDD